MFRKHHEEILEIVFERMDMIKSRKCELEIQAVYAVQNTPLTKVSVEMLRLAFPNSFQKSGEDALSALSFPTKLNFYLNKICVLTWFWRVTII